MSAPAGPDDTAVEVRGLVKAYGALRAVDGLDLTVRRASVTAVLGPNGAGKTTTIETCEGYRRPDAGSVRVLGLDPYADGPALRPRVGVMLQEGGGGYPGARADELLRHFAVLHAHPLDVDALTERLGLAGAARTPYRRLSGGQRQRLALAIALVGRPELVFLDEPTAGMDPQIRRDTWDLVRELQIDGVTIVLTTHLIDEAEQLADHVVIIDHGRVVAHGAPELLTGAAGEHTVRFTGPPRLPLQSLRSALSAELVVEEAAPGSYLVAGPVDPQVLASITAWCASHDLMPDRLVVGRRSLEDVFLELTGRQARP